MKLAISNFGPIQEATVETRPLTVIIGKNNLGKSYLAMLLHSLTTVQQIRSSSYVDWSGEPIASFDLSLSTRLFEMASTARMKEMTPESIVDRIVDLVTKGYRMKDILRLAFERSFGVNVGELVNVNHKKANINCTMGEYSSLDIDIFADGNMEVEWKIDRKKLMSHLGKTAEKMLERQKSYKRFSPAPIYDLSVPIIRAIFPRIQKKSIYIPAGRAGLLEGYHTVSSALYSLSTIGPIRGIDIPPLPGMASSFYNLMLGLRGKRGPLASTADRINELYGGEISVRLAPETKIATLTYDFLDLAGTKHSIDVIHAASMIREIAPIYAIVRELVEKNDFMIVEEPESHLHPGAQLKFAEILASLTKSKVDVLLTTHSPIILRRIAHLTGRKEKTQGSLTHDAVALYWLKDGESGSVAEPLEVLPHGAFDTLPTFDEVTEELYEEEVTLEERSQLGEKDI